MMSTFKIDYGSVIYISSPRYTKYYKRYIMENYQFFKDFSRIVF